MDQHQLEIIANDEREVRDPRRRLAVRAKLAWYALSRPFMSGALRRRLLKLEPRLAEDPVFQHVNIFLNGDGGMFKEHVYKYCSRFIPIRGASVLVPGIGYGKNLLQLAAFRPKEIVAFDLYEYPEMWRFLAEKIQKEFGVPVTFYKGDFDAVPRDHAGSFDFVISDAVLEHVPDMPKFAAGSRDFLKPGGIFYASFGPLWYGPSGDHAEWGPDKIFDHILLSKEAYLKQLNDAPPEVACDDSCETLFMIRENLFSYLRGAQYLEYIEGNGLKIFDLRSKVSLRAMRLLAERKDIATELDTRQFPLFDRYSGGMYIWARKP